MAELQSHILNDVELTARVSDSDQIVQFVEASIRETSADVPDMSKLGLTYRSTEEEKKITLSYDGRELGSVDASDFVKDGMISDVSYDEATHVLSILWNSDGGSKVTEVNLSGLLDTYTAGEGLSLSNGEFSLTANIPSNVSELSNDSGFVTADETSRVFIDDRISGVSGQSDLSVVKLSSDEYARMLSAGTVLSNCLYVVESPFNNTYGQQAKNMAAGTDLSDAVTLGQLDWRFDSLFACLSAVRRYGSPQEVLLSAVVNAIWCLSKLQQWAAE